MQMPQISHPKSSNWRCLNSVLNGCRDTNMKMFNWVQKKLSWGSDYHRVSNGKAPDVFIEEDEERVVINGERSNEMLGHRMPDNILAIGTFDHSHHRPLNCTEKKSLQEEVKENDLRMMAMVQTAGTLISSRYKYNPPSLLKFLQCKTSIMEEMVEDNKEVKKKMMELVMVEQVKYSSCELLQPLLKMDKERNERTTLADLLAIEASFSRTCSPLEVR
ncbi:putative neurofilament medium polypeptide [Cocos nucifera]|uniref:Protein TILLER ANGLE CONTROL 1 n=1 Tax=Cocos nucifera TaxID=13894 RepID=A0A8K0IF49_COCNU|nr:putative neurofilament medium polypeptide [Cocos nucifera]